MAWRPAMLGQAEKEDLLREEPAAAQWIRPYCGANEFLNGELRWCLWLKAISPTQLAQLPAVRSRVEKVRDMRLQSKAEATRRRALTPILFAQDAQPNENYILVPLHSSENRPYMVVGFVTPDVIASNACATIPGASLYDLGVLSSAMHIA